MRKIEVCPGDLVLGYETYSPSCLHTLFDGAKVSPILDFDYNADSLNLAERINQISISGVQEKLSAVVKNNKIILTPNGEQGHYIIKPAPNYKHLQMRNQIPANEHLTMQIAKQVYKIKVAENGLIFFANGEVAYITKRFDFDDEGKKVRQEDFSSLAQKSSFTHGKDYKYTGSYEDVADLLKQNVATWMVEMTKLYTLIVFNYLFCNGDAHLKNFSIRQSVSGDYLLSPAYDLLNTSLHVKDEDFALQEGLMPKLFYSETYCNTGHPCKTDFITFGRRIGVLPKKLQAIIDMFSEQNPLIFDLIDNSFMDAKAKRMYRRLYQERWNRFMRE